MLPNFTPSVTNYIEKAAPFAQPVLHYLRSLIHKTCPQIEECIKWGFPHFTYKNEIVCSFAAFKQHCAFTFWRAGVITSLAEIAINNEGMGQLGKIKSKLDLPNENQLVNCIIEAIQLIEKGVKPAKSAKQKNNEPIILPAYFSSLLAEFPTAKEKFLSMSNSHQKEYVEWITEAKTETTRNTRMQTCIKWVLEGKGRNWQYQTKRTS